MTGKTIPGPREIPFVGSVNQFAHDPLAFLTELARDYGDIAQYSMFGRSFVLVSNPDSVRELLVEKADIFPKAPRTMNAMGKFLGHGLLTNEGPAHRSRRKLMQPVFHIKRIHSYADVMVAYTTTTVDGWQDGEVREINREMMQLTMTIVAKTLFDADPTSLAGLTARVGQAVQVFQNMIDHDLHSLWVPPDWMPTPRNRRQREAKRTLDAAIDQLLRRAAARRSTVLRPTMGICSRC